MTMSLPLLRGNGLSQAVAQPQPTGLSPAPYFSPLRRAAARGPGLTSEAQRPGGPAPASSSQMGR